VVFDAGPLLTLSCSNSAAFHAVGKIYGTDATWTAAVRDEVADKSRLREWECGRQILRASWLPNPPVALDDPADLTEIEDVRQVFVRAEDGPRKHLGEAASIVLARRSKLPVVLDDQDAVNYARFSEHLVVHRTLELLLGVLEAKELLCLDGWETYIKMKARARLPQLTRGQLCPSVCGKHR
jgi:hypothetical protein